MKILMIAIFYSCFFFNSLIYPENNQLPIKYLNQILDQQNGKTLTYDPARQSIYQKLEAQIRMMAQLVSNYGDMLSYYQMMDGVLQNLIDIMQKIRVLALKKQDQLTTDQAIIEQEITQYYQTLFNILKNTEFNRLKLFKHLFDQSSILDQFLTANHYQLTKIDLILTFLIRQRIEAGLLSNQFHYYQKTHLREQINKLDFQQNINLVQAQQIQFMAHLLDL